MMLGKNTRVKVVVDIAAMMLAAHVWSSGPDRRALPDPSSAHVYFVFLVAPLRAGLWCGCSSMLCSGEGGRVA
jgi:hypothetical protein